MAKITVQDTEITISNVNGEDYICITDMLKAKDGDIYSKRPDSVLNKYMSEYIRK